MSEYETESYSCFNDFFVRRIRPEKRPVRKESDVLIAPADGLLLVYPIRSGTVVTVKEKPYTISSLLRNEALSEEYDGGYCCIFRLCVHHYHRYCYPADGKKGENVFIDGKLHTVRPIALDTLPVFSENCREYTVLDTARFGKIVQMEVGAMFVGRILNYDSECTFFKGQEKGCFLYGGSTVILLIQKNRVKIPERFLAASSNGIETEVRQGELIGIAE